MLPNCSFRVAARSRTTGLDGEDRTARRINRSLGIYDDRVEETPNLRLRLQLRASVIVVTSSSLSYTITLQRRSIASPWTVEST